YEESNDPKVRARYHEFVTAKHHAECHSKFIRECQRFPLTASGDINTYSIFAELARRIIKSNGRMGLLLPTGIATDDTTKDFFGDLVVTKSLIKITGFENEAFIFPAVHHAFKFCALTAGEIGRSTNADFVFLCRHFDQVSDVRRHFALSTEDFGLLNPN